MPASITCVVLGIYPEVKAFTFLAALIHDENHKPDPIAGERPVIGRRRHVALEHQWAVYRHRQRGAPGEGVLHEQHRLDLPADFEGLRSKYGRGLRRIKDPG